MLNKLKKINPLIFIIILSFAVRLVNLNQSLWLDEAAQAWESSRPTSQQFNIVGDFQPPLLHLIVHLFYQISSADWFLRLPSVIAGVITIVFAYKIAKYLFGRQVAILTGIIGATSPYHYYFSQELRQYSLAAMWASMSVWYYIKWKNSKSNKISLGYVLSTAAGVYTMYVFPFLIWFQLIHVILFKRKKLISFLKQIFIVVGLFTPWIPMFIKQLQTGISLKNSFAGWSTAVSLPWHKALPLTYIKLLIGMIPVEANLVQVILFSLVFISLFLIIKPIIKNKKSLVLICWLFSPVIWAFMFSFLIPILEPKRLLFVIPAFWILLSAGLLKTKYKKILIPVFLIIQLTLLGFHFTKPDLKRENWKQAVNYIETSSYQDKVVIFAFSGDFAPWTWYQTDRVPHIATKTLTVPSTKYLDENISKSLEYETIFVFEYLMDLTDPDRLVLSWLKTHGYTNTQIKDFHGVGFIYIYQKQLPLASK